jgi:3,4-dihydroxy 2-butanone 4-phosphate synthase/GTP cyclohydrolase II
MFPLVAKPNGTKQRRGHTEATVDMCKLSGCEPVGLICELMHPDGTMRRFDACYEFAKHYGLPIITVEQIVQYRESRGDSPLAPSLACQPGLPKRLDADDRLTLTAECSLPVRTQSISGARGEADFKLMIFRDLLTDDEHSVLVYGDVAGKKNVYTRIHSECMTGNTLNSLKCDCGPQVRLSVCPQLLFALN